MSRASEDALTDEENTCVVEARELYRRSTRGLRNVISNTTASSIGEKCDLVVAFNVLHEVIVVL